MKDNRANCIQFSIENTAGTLLGNNDTTNAIHLLPAAAQTFRVIATKYHFLCFYPGAPTTTSRNFIMGGMLSVPSFLSGVTDVGFMIGNARSDTATGRCTCFRHGVTWQAQEVSPDNVGIGNFEIIWNSNILQGAGTDGPGIGHPKVIVVAVTDHQNNTGITGYRWANDDINTSDILMSSGLAATSDEGKIKGQFFDLIYIADAFAIDSTDTFSSHNWFNLTNNQTGFNDGNCPRGGVWVATS
jgi:hypothetical protein